ncbi:MAG TPA: hypothetical protein VJ203_06090 [Bacteroidales bacterium]|nr:hypothetical protein [Bacteroidales bacterium]
MKTSIIPLIVCFLLTGELNGQAKDVQTDSVEVITEFRNLYRYQNYFLGGQPTYEMLQWLKSQGVTKIINLRTERENSEFTTGSFNETAVAGQMGFTYSLFPVDGRKDYSPGKLEEFSRLVSGEDIIFIHCASAGRVTNFFMGYLIKSKGNSVDEAVAIGKQLAFYLPLEDLLNAEIHMEAGK